jgi:hypothetical protein
MFDYLKVGNPWKPLLTYYPFFVAVGWKTQDIHKPKHWGFTWIGVPLAPANDDWYHPIFSGSCRLDFCIWMLGYTWHDDIMICIWITCVSNKCASNWLIPVLDYSKPCYILLRSSQEVSNFFNFLTTKTKLAKLTTLGAWGTANVAMCSDGDAPRAARDVLAHAGITKKWPGRKGRPCKAKQSWLVHLGASALKHESQSDFACKTLYGPKFKSALAWHASPTEETSKRESYDVGAQVHAQYQSHAV